MIYMYVLLSGIILFSLMSIYLNLFHRPTKYFNTEDEAHQYIRDHPEEMHHVPTISFDKRVGKYFIVFLEY